MLVYIAVIAFINLFLASAPILYSQNKNWSNGQKWNKDDSILLRSEKCFIDARVFSRSKGTGQAYNLLFKKPALPPLTSNPCTKWKIVIPATEDVLFHYSRGMIEDCDDVLNLIGLDMESGTDKTLYIAVLKRVIQIKPAVVAHCVL